MGGGGGEGINLLMKCPRKKKYNRGGGNLDLHKDQEPNKGSLKLIGSRLNQSRKKGDQRYDSRMGGGAQSRGTSERNRISWDRKGKKEMAAGQ